MVTESSGADPRTLVLVAGSGRSGTSTVAGILRRLGAHVPQPEVAADESNPRGFGEPQWAVDLHDRLLREAMVQVTDSRPDAWRLTREVAAGPGLRREVADWLGGHFSSADELVVKDPRLTWFHDLWRGAVEEAGARPAYVTMLRPPPEVVASRRRHYNARMADAFGIAAWVNLMLGTERATRGQQRVFLRYPDLIGDWRAAVQPLGEHLGLASVLAATPEAESLVDGFVDPSLRRNQPGWDDLDLPQDLRAIAQEAWEVLDLLADPAGDDPDRHARLDELAVRYAHCFAAAEAVARSSIVAAQWRGRAEASGAPGADGAGGAERVASSGWRARLGRLRRP